MASWDQRLSRRIVLRGDRAPLVTLRDAATCLQAEFVTTRRNHMLDGAIEDLIAAAESGSAADRAAATDQVERVLADARLADLTANAAAPRSDLEARIRAVLAGTRLTRKSRRGPR